MDAETIFIDINNSFIDINKSAANVLNGKTGCSLWSGNLHIWRAVRFVGREFPVRVGNYKLLEQGSVFY